MERQYEIRFVIWSNKKIQTFRMFVTRANSYAEAMQNFIDWANSPEPKTDARGKAFSFDRLPVTEKYVISIARIDW